MVNSTSSTSLTLHSECGIIDPQFSYPKPPDVHCHVLWFTILPNAEVGHGEATNFPYLLAEEGTVNLGVNFYMKLVYTYSVNTLLLAPTNTDIVCINCTKSKLFFICYITAPVIISYEISPPLSDTTLVMVSLSIIIIIGPGRFNFQTTAFL